MKKRNSSRRDFLRSAATAATISLETSATDAATPGPPQLECGSVWERPPKQQGNNLNVIVLVSDTFRRDNLTCFGKKWLEGLETPNLDKFAEDCVACEDFYPEGMPTVVIRRNLYTGRRTVPLYYVRQHEPVQLPGWDDLYNEDVTLSETLLEAGYLTVLVSDLPHQQRPGRNFHRGFSVYQWIRGQEVDNYGTSPHKLLDVGDIVPNVYLDRFPDLHSFLSRYKANRNLWAQEGESLSQLVSQTASRWLQANFDQRPFYMHVEMFDSHEPWDPPRRFLEKYSPNASGPSYLEPPYDTVPLPEEVKQRLRANYAGEVSCVDYWIGELLGKIKELGLFENSVIVFLSDHGTMLGEHGQFLKGPDKLRGQVTHIPLLIRLPGRQNAGKKLPGLIQVADVMPTLLHLLDLKPPPRVTGSNFWPLLTGEAKSLHEYVVQTYGWVGAARTREWNYSQIWKPEARQEKYSVSPGAPLTTYQPQLYDLDKDPQESVNVAARYPDVVREMSSRLKDYIASGVGLTNGSFNERASLDMGQVYVKGTR